MTCDEARRELSLYLYGELSFDDEEQLDVHLGECSECREALVEEQKWHRAIGNESGEVPIGLLSKCREQLRDEISVAREAAVPLWLRCWDSLGLRSNSWTMRLATASLLVCLGFGMSRLVDRYRLLSPNSAANGGAAVNDASLVGTWRSHVRAIRMAGDDRVHFVVDDVRERDVSGRLEEEGIRQLLLAASKDPTDAVLRVDSLELLKELSGADVRETLLRSAMEDPSAGVRAKALEALQPYANEADAQQVILAVLSHDQNADVRTQAIEVLVQPGGEGPLSPQLAGTLGELMRSDPNRYIRMRCQQALSTTRHPVQMY